MAIAFFTVYRVYNWEFNSRKEIKVILPTGDGPFLNLLIYYMNIAKNVQLCFWVKCIFLPKNAIFPKTWILVHVFGNIHIINKEV